MNHQINSQTKADYFSLFTSKFPSLKSEVIKQAINKFNYDYDKINDFLAQRSFEESSSYGKKSSSDSMKSPGYFSFASLTGDSLESDPNSPASTRSHYKNSSELSTISSQTCDLKRLQDAFRNMETNRDYLVKEKECLIEVSSKRKSAPSFPTITELEKLEMTVNSKHSMPPKSISYANDLRRPEEMNSRYRGFQQPYNEYAPNSYNNNNFNNNNNNNNNSINGSNRRNSENPVMINSLNPNFYVSPKPKNNILNPLRRQDEKRNSAHFTNFELPEEFRGPRQGHFRQSSDPRILDNLSRDGWNCPQCDVFNTLSKCTFCQYDKIQSDRL